MMHDSQEIVESEADAVSRSDHRPRVTITIMTSMQNYKIDASLDAHHHASNAHMYWIPGNMMLNAISGIAPIS